MVTTAVVVGPYADIREGPVIKISIDYKAIDLIHVPCKGLFKVFDRLQ